MSETRAREPTISQIISYGLVMMGVILSAVGYVMHSAKPLPDFESWVRMCVLLILSGLFGLGLNMVFLNNE